MCSALNLLILMTIVDVIANDNEARTPPSKLFADDLTLCNASQADLEER